MLRIYIVLLAFCCLGIAHGTAQVNPILVLNKAQKVQLKENYLGAIDLYKQVLEADSGFIKAYIGLVECYYTLQQYESAKSYLIQIEQKQASEKFENFWCYKADIEWITTKNAELATQYYKQCKSANSSLPDFWNDKQKQLKKLSKQQNSNWHSLSIDSIQHIRLNSSNAVYAPCFSGRDSLVFVQYSDDNQSFEIKGFDIISNEAFSYTFQDSLFGLTQVFSIYVDSLSKFAVVCASGDAYQKQLFWAWVHPKIKVVEVVKAIDLEGFESTHCIHPQFIIEGKDTTLYFSSNHQNGEGGFDLYLATFTQKGRNKVGNLGKKLNTSGNELAPNYTHNGLYYSSDFALEFNGFNIQKNVGSLHKYRSVSTLLDSTINSDFDETFIRFYGNSGVFTSNKSITDSDTSCCMQLFVFKLSEDSCVQDSIITTLVDSTVLIEQELLSAAPTLYFHNDEPNPNTTDSTTSLNFSTIYENYAALEKLYVQKAAKAQKAEIQLFFTNDLPESYRDLFLFTTQIHKTLKQGKSVQLTIKGYASALAKSDYNKNLTLRRIESFINYLATWNGGLLKPFIESNQLTFTKIPYGESRANQALTSSKTSIYSIEAIYDRKIEVIAVEVANE